MERKQDGGEIFRLEEWEALAAELIKIPKERRSEVQQKTVIFITGMERARGLESAAASEREGETMRQGTIFQAGRETTPETRYGRTERD